MRFDPGAHKPKDKLPTERTMTDAEVAKAIEEAESEEPWVREAALHSQRMCLALVFAQCWNTDDVKAHACPCLVVHHTCGKYCHILVAEMAKPLYTAFRNM